VNDEIMEEFKLFNSKEICGTEAWLIALTFRIELTIMTGVFKQGHTIN